MSLRSYNPHCVEYVAQNILLPDDPTLFEVHKTINFYCRILAYIVNWIKSLDQQMSIFGAPFCTMIR